MLNKFANQNRISAVKALEHIVSVLSEFDDFRLSSTEKFKMRHALFFSAFVTSLLFFSFFFSDATASEDSATEFGFYPQNLEYLEGGPGPLGRRRNGPSLLEILADYYPSGSGERNFWEPKQRRLHANALERPLWSRLFAKDIKDSPVDAQVGAGVSGVVQKISYGP